MQQVTKKVMKKKVSKSRIAINADEEKNFVPGWHILH